MVEEKVFFEFEVGDMGEHVGTKSRVEVGFCFVFAGVGA